MTTNTKRLLLISCAALIAISCVCPISSFLNRITRPAPEQPQLPVIPEFVTRIPPMFEDGGESELPFSTGEPGMEGPAEGILELIPAEVFHQQTVTKAIYGLINTSTDRMVVDSTVQIVAFTADGKVADSQTGYASLLLPKQKMMYVAYLNVSEGTAVDRVEVTLIPGTAKSSDMDGSIFTASDVTYFDSEYSPTITALLSNNSDLPAMDLNITALGYDSAGDIVSIATGYQNMLPPGVPVPIQMYIESIAKPETVEIFTTLSYLDGLIKKDWIQPSYEIIKSSFIQKAERITAVYLLKNASPKAWQGVTFNTAVYDSDGRVLASVPSYINYLYADQEFAIVVDFFVPSGYQADEIKVIPLTQLLYEGKLLANPLVVEQADFMPDQYNPKVTGLIRNDSDKQLQGIQIVTVVEDSSGTIIGGGVGYLDQVLAGGTGAFTVSVNVDGNPAKASVYPLLPYYE